MGLIEYARAGNLKRFKNNLKEISKKEKKSEFFLFNHFLLTFLKTGCGYSDYLNYELYNKTFKEIDEYVTIKHQDKFYEIVSPAKYKTFFTIKPNFLNNFKDYINRSFFAGGTIEELKAFLDKNEEFMVKPYDGLGGKGVYKEYRKNIKNVNDFYNYLNENHLFIEEYVKQNKEVNRLCKESVNTIRIMTFSYNGKSEIVYAAMRIGNGINNVDNFHQGGMGCKIDLEKGILIGDAIDKDLNHYEVHPKSKVKFDGFVLPNWEKAKKLVLDASLVNNNIHMVGWDVALTDEGATLIEGNRRPGFDLIQVLSKRGRKDIMRHCLDIINKEEGTNYKI
ncbi:putative uncharacterized protein [Firmicutes bacterium CAG:884]|nr:hypothetical protein [Bacillota bacterium]CCY93415.1 putative uncharacterized protein [Firmicutes bacterium CAG:884]